jgi:DNA primase
MALYTQDSIQRVKDAVDLVEVVGARTDLRRVGQRWTGLCPFHDERTPSFGILPEKGLYHCFGCGESGDAIKFVRETESLDFVGALETLAERYNVELQREDEDPEAEERRRRRERLIKLVDRAAGYYARVLWDSPEAAPAREYLRGRGLGEDVLRDFRIGFSPGAWDRLVQGAQRDGFTAEDLIAAGLAQRSRTGGLIDRFRGRIMFPLVDARGRTLGFGARKMAEEEQGPKYLNTAENELYHKGRQLFGIDRARGPAGKAGRVIAVEGYTDVLALHQAGVGETVAIMGTAVTPEQLIQLGQAAPSIYFALDADSAGQEAMARAARVAEQRGLEMRVVALPPGSDPADLVARNGAEAFGEFLEGAISVPEFEVKRKLAAADLSTPGGRDEALSGVVRVISEVPRYSATWDHLVRYVSDRLKVDPHYLETLLPAPTTKAPPRTDYSGGGDVPHTSRLPSIEAAGKPERSFLAMCLANGQTGRRYLDELDDDHFSSQALLGVRDHLIAHFDDPLASLPDDPGLADLITGVVFEADTEAIRDASLPATHLLLNMQRTDRLLRRAEQSADYETQRALWPQRETLRRKYDELMGQTQ